MDVSVLPRACLVQVMQYLKHANPTKRTCDPLVSWISNCSDLTRGEWLGLLKAPQRSHLRVRQKAADRIHAQLMKLAARLKFLHRYPTETQATRAI